MDEHSGPFRRDPEGYLAHFAFDQEPFALTSDPAFLFLSESHARTADALDAGVRAKRGLMIVTGESGTGKTTLANALLHRWRDEHRVAFVKTGTFTSHDILSRALRDYGVEDVLGRTDDRVGCLENVLREARSEDRIVVLVVDEAQNLTPQTLDQIRRLQDLEAEPGELIQIVLIGQPELAKRLGRGELRTIRDRVAVQHRLNSLSRAESRAYVRHRLEVVGGDPELFEAAALAEIVREADGLPHALNVLCHNALLFAFGAGVAVVDQGIALKAIEHSQIRSPSSSRATRWLSGVAAALLLATGLTLVVALQGGPFDLPQNRSAPVPREESASIGPRGDGSQDPDGARGSTDIPSPLARSASLASSGAPPVTQSGATDVRVQSATLAGSIESRDPEDVATTFDVDVERVFFWNLLSVGDEAELAEVEHVWYFADREVARIPLEVVGPTWRTWSEKRIRPGQVGEWKVEVVGERGEVLESLDFRVE